MRIWVTAVIMSLQASLSLAYDIPKPVTHSDFPTLNINSVLLSRDLFYDPVLSGNRNISCATCHHPALGTSDGMSLSIGEGGRHLGAAREVINGQEPHARIPRNAPALYNLGAFEYVTMFHDGRVELDAQARFGIRMPEGRRLERPVPNVLAAQAILPILSPDEMAGQAGENPVADAVAAERIHGLNGAWQMLAARVETIRAYRTRFDWVIGADEPIHITHIGRALADYIAFEFRATQSPFDAYIGGDHAALSAAARRGMDLFYGEADCAACHSGPLQTDHGFHAIGVPPLGPGKANGTAPHTDTGRFAVSGIEKDAYCFRTPTLRNVALTAPYGHNGAYRSLRAMIAQHLDPIGALTGYDPAQAQLHDLPALPDDFAPQRDQEEMIRIAAASEITPRELTQNQMDDLIAFLESLTDPSSERLQLGLPTHVPSGLTVDAPGTRRSTANR